MAIEAVIGVRAVERNMKKIIKNTMEGFIDGLILVGLKIQRDAQQLVPVDLANLKASAYVVWTGGVLTSPQFKNKDSESGSKADTMELKSDHGIALNFARDFVGTDIMKPAVIVGFSASYAFIVHEDLQANHPNGGEAKYLTKALLRNKSDIILLTKAKLTKGLLKKI